MLAIEREVVAFGASVAHAQAASLLFGQLLFKSYFDVFYRTVSFFLACGRNAWLERQKSISVPEIFVQRDRAKFFNICDFLARENNAIHNALVHLQRLVSCR